MDARSLDGQCPESKECAVHYSENTSFILGTEKLVTPENHVAEVAPQPCTPQALKSPFDFSTVSVEQLGITPESFVKIPSEDFVTGKSRSYLQKSRRRSAVGTRGSPETNHLIRFIAQQRRLKSAEQSPLAHGSPLQHSPGLYRNPNSLREQMSAFQSAFYPIQEAEMVTGSPAVKTSAQTKKEGLTEYRQSRYPVNLSSKRRRISSQNGPDEHLSSLEEDVMGAPVFRTDANRACATDTSEDLAEKSSKLGSAQSGCIVAEAVLPEPMGTSHATAQASPETANSRVPAAPLCRNISPPSENFVLRSVLKKPGKLFAENLQAYHSIYGGATHPNSIPDPLFCCIEPKEDQENGRTPVVNVRKRKRVTFGEDLSPEVFDQSLPANTPLRKGGTPVRQKDLSDASPQLLRQSPAPEQLLQPNFDDSGENLENIEPTEVSFAVPRPTKSSVSEALSATDTFSSSNNHEKITSYNSGRPARTSNRRKQLVSFAEENFYNSHNTEAEPCKEKKINRRKSQDSKCSTNKALPKKKPVFKGCRKKRKGKKDVQKSLYGERDIASKKPLLSPIPELPEASEMTPSTTGLHRISTGDFNLNGKLEEVFPLETPMKRKRLLPPNEHRVLDESEVSGLCCFSLPGTAASKGGPSASTMYTDGTDMDTDGTDMYTDGTDMYTDGTDSLPQAENELESAKEPKAETTNEDSHIPCASLTKGHIVSDCPKPVCAPQCQESSSAGQIGETLCDILKISETVNVKYEEDKHSAAKGMLQADPSVSDSEKELDFSEDVLAGNIEESANPIKNAGRRSVESGVSDRERKHPRCSEDHRDGQRSQLEQNKSHASSCSVQSSVESSSEYSQLCKDLSHIIEQTFQRTNGETKVRRSTRLLKDLEGTGLMWMALPFSSTSRKTKRKTICTFDSREYQSVPPQKETVSSEQKLDALPSVSGRESHESHVAGSSRLPGKRRKSFYGSTLTSTQSTRQPPGFRRGASLGGGSKLSAAPRGLNEEN